MSIEQSYDHDDVDYTNQSAFPSKRRESTAAKNKPNQSRRRVKTPQSINGMHRRRRRKMSW